MPGVIADENAQPNIQQAVTLKKPFLEVRLGEAIPQAEQPQAQQDQNDDSSSSDDDTDIFYIPQKQYDALKLKLSKGQVIKKEEVDIMVNNDSLGDDEIVVAVDMGAAGEDLDDWEPQLKKLGAKRIAECFVKAREHFVNSSAADWENELKPHDTLTMKEWRDQQGDDEEEGGEEEEAQEDDEEEDAEEDEAESAAEEPAAKKAKTKK